ncbi:deoxycytidylate deaminase [[Clostridium] colinum]|uniref:deoxycytidylate deaminase n=1 Tax=[Clostridium] colinum TaxID=36835 RepID=UPI0024E09F16|nr:cytidine/deoxycytidylate deaminase family protein [[Clostridium] colinum]
MQRIDWDTYFIEIAKVVAKRASCFRRQVGAVIVKDNSIISTGYNGAPKGILDCFEINKCIRNDKNIPSGKNYEECMSLHAENNAITQCASNGVSCKGGTIYITHSPCSMCLKQIINAGIKRIVSIDKYPDELSDKLIKMSNIEFVLFKDKE